MEALLQKLNVLNNQVERPNAGGCAIIMLAIYRYLRKNNELTEHDRFVYTYSSTDGWEFNENSKILHEGQQEVRPSSCDHALFLHKDKYIDVDGLHEYPTRSVMHILSPEYEKFVVESLNNKIQWNKRFDREEYVPVIEEVLEISLSDINL